MMKVNDTTDKMNGTAGELIMNDTQISYCEEVHQWMVNASIVFSTISMCVSTYVLVALLYHQYLVKIKKNLNIEKHRGFREIKRFSNILGLLAILGAFCISLRSTVDIFTYVSVVYYRIELYPALSKTQLFLNIFTLCCIYTVLWLRMWIFYNHSAMAQLKSKWTVALCWLLFCIMVVTSSGNALFFIMDRKVMMKDSMVICRYPLQWGNIKFYLLGSCTIFYQVMLLALFIFPLVNQKSIRGRGASSKRRFLKVLKRVLMVTVTCAVTDMVVIPLSTKWDSKFIDISFLFYNVNILVNFICLLYSYGDWKLRVFSVFVLHHHLKSHPSIYTSSSDTTHNRSTRRGSSILKKTNELHPLTVQNGRKHTTFKK